MFNRFDGKLLIDVSCIAPLEKRGNNNRQDGYRYGYYASIISIYLTYLLMCVFKLSLVKKMRMPPRKSLPSGYGM